RVHFIGERNDVAPYFDAADVFLVTSREEALPLVMLEAAMHKLPVVCFDQSGHPPEFVAQDAGFIVPDFDPIRMGDRVIELLADAALRGRMGQTASRKVATEYNFTVSAAQMIALIEDLLDRQLQNTERSQGLAAQ